MAAYENKNSKNQVRVVLKSSDCFLTSSLKIILFIPIKYDISKSKHI